MKIKNNITEFEIRVRVKSNRPDFRIFASYFFGDDFYNYDSEGDCLLVTSEKWTELYVRSRENSDLWFEIYKEDEEQSLILKVSSKNIETTYIIAYFLARETNGEVLDNDNEIILMSTLEKLMGDFDLENRLLIADNSIWREATTNNPYPNLNK